MGVEEFYAALPRPVTVGIESTGYAVWFHTLMQRLGHTLLGGTHCSTRSSVSVDAYVTIFQDVLETTPA